jgi:hypothetical protein
MPITSGDRQVIRRLWQEEIDHLRNEMETVEFLSLDGWRIQVVRGLIDEVTRSPGALGDLFARLFVYDPIGLISLDPGPVTPQTTEITHNTGEGIFFVDQNGQLTINEAGVIDITIGCTVGQFEPGSDYEASMWLEIDVNDGVGWVEVPGSRRYMGAGSSV